MDVSARAESAKGKHHVTLRTGERVHGLAVAPKPTGPGSSVSGGELLFLALATCYCNDLYREAAKRGIGAEHLGVEVTGAFGAEGEAATNVRYSVRVAARADEAGVRALLTHTDRLAEVHNTLRVGTPVVQGHAEIIPV